MLRHVLSAALAFVAALTLWIGYERSAGPTAAPLPEHIPATLRVPPAHDFSQPARLANALNPGSELHAMHAAGWTGAGVGIAIVDSCLLVDHREYWKRLRWYDEIDVEPGDYARWHGTAVASLAAGETLGAAPGADLYYAAVGVHWAREPLGNLFVELRRAAHSGQPLALAIRRILELNEKLEPGRRIRALSLSIGAPPRGLGGAAVEDAIEDARAAGLFVSAADLNLAPYGPVNIASPSGADAVAGFQQPAGSWAIARAAGRYAVECQRDPSMTPQRFLAAYRGGR